MYVFEYRTLVSHQCAARGTQCAARGTQSANDVADNEQPETTNVALTVGAAAAGAAVGLCVAGPVTAVALAGAAVYAT
jgi:hypothetical protein